MNWKVRFKNKTFWLALVPAVLILINALLGVFGIKLDFENLQESMISLVEAVFTVLAILGIVVDPTTSGITDSKLAKTYETPYDSEAEVIEYENLQED